METVEKLYLTIDEAAEYAGIGQKAMREMVNSQDPPPLLRLGAKRLIQREGLAPYLERKQEIRAVSVGFGR